MEFGLFIKSIKAKLTLGLLITPSKQTIIINNFNFSEKSFICFKKHY